MDVGPPCIFRVTRDADLALDDDAADDLLLALQEELRRRRFLPVVRLEIDSRTSEVPVSAPHRGAGARPRRRLPVRRSPGARLPLGHPRPRPARTPRRAVDAAHPPGAHHGGARGGRQHLFGARPAGRPRPPPLRLVLGVGRGADERGRRRPPRPGHQAVPLPDLRRQPGGGRPGAGSRARQAGGGAGRGHGPVRRGGQHRMGASPRGGRRPRHLRADGPEDPRQDHTGGPAGGRARCASTATWARATTTPRPPGSTRTWASCPPAPRSVPTSPGSSTTSPGSASRPTTRSWSPRPAASATGSSTASTRSRWPVPTGGS